MNDRTKPVTESELIERSEYPRVTKEQLLNVISHFEFAYYDLSVVCILTLKNGFTLFGSSGCAVPGNWKKDMGERLAYQDAEKQIWPLLGYALKDKVALVKSTPFPNKLGVFNEDFIKGLTTYVGTKVVRATPMRLGDYNIIRGWEAPKGEDPDRMGYIVQYPDGHVSWSPKETFEVSYQKIDINGEGSKGGPSFLDRLREEEEQLREKLSKLQTFLGSKAFLNLDDENRQLLNEQEEYMADYLRVLEKRLESLA